MALTEWDLVCVTGSAIDADGFADVQYDGEGDEPGSAGNQPPAVPPHELHQWLGLWAMPLDPATDAGGQIDASKACTMLKAIEGGKGHAWMCEDPRVIGDLVPAPAPGETVIHNCFGAYTRYRADGSIFHATTTTGGGKDGTAVYSCISPTGFVRTSPYGTERFGSFGPWTGYSLNVLGGARLTMGSAGGVVPGMSSYVRFQAHMFEINASVVAIGPEGSEPAPVTQVLPLTAALTQITTAATALTSATATLANAAAALVAATQAIPGATPAVAAAGAIVQSAIGQLSGAASQIATAAGAVEALPTTAGTASGIG